MRCKTLWSAVSEVEVRKGLRLYSLTVESWKRRRVNTSAEQVFSKVINKMVGLRSCTGRKLFKSRDSGGGNCGTQI